MTRLALLLLLLGCATAPQGAQPRPGSTTPSPRSPPPPPSSEPVAPPAPVLAPQPPATSSTDPVPPPHPATPAELHELEQRRLPGAVWPPPGHVPPACELELSTKAVRRGPVYEITAVARNKSAHHLTLELPDRCPQGAVVFAGLPGDYDYYRSCTKGACAGPRKPVRFELEPGEELELEAIDVDPGGANCTQPLPKKSYAVSFAVPFAGAVCAGKFAKITH